MPVSVEILHAPIGEIYTYDITGDEDDSKNDFDVFLVFSDNAPGLSESDISIAASRGTASIVDNTFRGGNRVYAFKVRPPEYVGTNTQETITITVAENAVDEGNAETEETINFRDRYNASGAQTFSTEFAHNLGGDAADYKGIAISPQRIYIAKDERLYSFLHDGTQQASERVDDFRASTAAGRADYRIAYVNDVILTVRGAHGSGNPSPGLYKYNLADETWDRIITLSAPINNADRPYYVTHSDKGFIYSTASDTVYLIPYGSTDVNDSVSSTPQFFNTEDTGGIAYSQGLMYGTTTRASLAVFDINDDNEVIFLREFHISVPSFAVLGGVFRDKIYLLTSTEVQSFDIRTYRPIAAKTSIYPIFIDEGETLDLLPLCPHAEDIIWDVGMDTPSYLSINASNELVVAADAVTETSPVLVKLKGLNRDGATEDETFSFYLVIEQATAPVWRDVSELAMPANSTYNLFQIVDRADSIVFRSGRTQPTGSSINNGIFTIGTADGTAYFTATKGTLTSHITIDINVIQTTLANFSDTFRYRVEIAGIDVTRDLNELPSISKHLDVEELNVYEVNETTLVLSDDGGKYNPDLPNNFWETNTLNAGGFREPINVFLESLVSGTWVSHLLFTGIVHTQAESISEIAVRLQCYSIDWILRNTDVREFGVLEKWDALRQQSDEASFEGVYVPEGSLTPMQVGTGSAWEDRTKLTISQLQLPSEGPPITNTAYMTQSDLRTSGGFLNENPIFRFKTGHRSEDARFLINQLALNGVVYNTAIALPDLPVSDPFILNRGSVPFSLENTRITRLVVDWVRDTTNQRVLMLLSNPESHIADQLVEYKTDTDRYRVLHTFDADLKVHRIEHRTATLYYLITSKGITQDRSASELPRQTDATGYTYDSAAAGSEIKIYRFNTSSSTLTEFVPEDDDRPPQLGIHYWTGYENAIYTDSFESIVPYYRGAFRWYDNNLYYRFATPTRFGVARVDTSGTTSEMISESDLNYNNWLNFAFDVDTSNGDVYFVYVTGTATGSTLTIKKRDSGGTETTVFTDTQDLEDLTALAGGGAYLGCYEAVYHNDNLYFTVPIQRVDVDGTDYTRSITKAAGLVLYRCNVNDATPALTSIVNYDFATRGACDLTVHDGNVHYLEQPIAAIQFRAINSDL